MTQREKQGIKALSNCTFLPGSFEKRIARTWREKLDEKPREKMTDKGKACLWKLVYRFRRQIADKELIEYAEWENKRNERRQQRSSSSPGKTRCSSPSAQ